MRRICSSLLALILCLTLALPNFVLAQDETQPGVTIAWTGADGTPYTAYATPVISSDGLTTFYYIPADQTMLTGEVGSYLVELTGWMEGAIVTPDAALPQPVEIGIAKTLIALNPTDGTSTIFHYVISADPQPMDAPSADAMMGALGIIVPPT